MAAGEGAAEKSRLAAERVARLRRELEHAERNAHAWSLGAAGEAILAEKLREIEPLGWQVIHDVHWPGRPQANLDHVLIGPGGIVVVDAKNWNGEVSLSGGTLRQNGYARHHSVAGVGQQAAAVAALLEPGHRRLVQGWICLVGQPELSGTASGGTRIEGLNTIARAVAELPTVLDAALIPTIHAYLQSLLGGATSPQLLSTAQFTASSTTASRPPSAATAPPETWGSRRGQSARSKAPRRSQRRRGPQQTSCLGALFRLAVLMILLSFIFSFLSGLRTAAPAGPPAPHPTPTVVQPVPKR